MKKLLTAISSVAVALAAFGETSSASFESDGYADGSQFVAGNDNNIATTPYFWYAPGAEEIGVLRAYPLTSVDAPVEAAHRPDQFQDQPNSKYLSLDTAAPLFRSFLANNHDEDLANAFTGVTIPDDGIYLDTLVRFTAAEDEFTEDLEDGDKIAIAYVEHPEEKAKVGEGDDATEEVVSEAYTSFVVRAGYIKADEVVQKNYFVTVPDGFDKNDWHRLTVRTIPAIDDAKHVGFVVYLDEKPLVYPASEKVGDDFVPTGIASTFVNAIFPSAIASGDNKDKIAAVSFSGTGAIDDIVLTTDVPAFVAASDVVPATITLGVGVTGVSVKIGDTEFEPLEAGVNPLVFNLPSGTTSFTLAATIDTEKGFEFNGVSDDVTYEPASGLVTWESGVPTFTVLAKRDNFVFVEDGVETDEKYATLSEALENNTGATIKLLWDYNVSDFEDANFKGFEINDDVGEVLLDLNGKVITGGDDDALFTVNGTLTIIDSSDANTGKIAYTGDYGVFYSDGSVYVGAVEGDNGPAIEGALLSGEGGDGIFLIRGKIDAANNSDGEDFGLEDYLGDGEDIEATATLVGQYWYVVPGEEELPTFYALTVPEVEGATAAVTVDGAAVVDITAIKEGTEVLVTWTADDGYSITSGETEEITMTANKTAATPQVKAAQKLTITAAANATYTVTIDGEEAATGADIESGNVIVITATANDNYEYKTEPDGWTLDEETGVITQTITVADASVTVAIPAPTSKSSESDYPTYIVDPETGTSVDNTVKDQYDAWKEKYGADANSEFSDAFLLNVDPETGDTDLDVVSIELKDGKVTISADHDLSDVNGYPYIQSANTLGELDAAPKKKFTIGADGDIVLDQDEAPAKFFRIGISYTPVE